MRKWVGESTDLDSATLFRTIFDQASELMEDNSIPQLVMHIANYQYKAAFVADQEINTIAFLLEVMADCDFK
jgi:replication factor C small subunit